MLDSALPSSQLLLAERGSGCSGDALNEEEDFSSRAEEQVSSFEETGNVPRNSQFLLSRKARPKASLRRAATQRTAAVEAALRGEISSVEEGRTRPRRKAIPSAKRLQALQDRSSVCRSASPPADSSRPSAASPTTTANSTVDSDHLTSEVEVPTSQGDRRVALLSTEETSSSACLSAKGFADRRKRRACESSIDNFLLLEKPTPSADAQTGSSVGDAAKDASSSAPTVACQQQTLSSRIFSVPSTGGRAGLANRLKEEVLWEEEGGKRSGGTVSSSQLTPAYGFCVEPVASFNEIIDLVKDLPPKKAREAQDLIEGVVVPEPPYGPVIVDTWKVQLGESGRGDLKRQISECVARCPLLKPSVNAVSKLKTATVEQLVVIAEIVGLLKAALQIAHRYERDRLNCVIGSRRTSRIRLNGGSLLAEFVPNSLTPAQDVELFDRYLRARPKRRLFNGTVDSLTSAQPGEDPSSREEEETSEGLSAPAPSSAEFPSQFLRDPAAEELEVSGKQFQEGSGSQALMHALSKLFPQSRSAESAQSVSCKRNVSGSSSRSRGSLPASKRSRTGGSRREGGDGSCVVSPQSLNVNQSTGGSESSSLAATASRLSSVFLQDILSASSSDKVNSSTLNDAASPAEQTSCGKHRSNAASSPLLSDVETHFKRLLRSCGEEGLTSQGRTRQNAGSSSETNCGIDDATLLNCLLKLASNKADLTESKTLVQGRASPESSLQDETRQRPEPARCGSASKGDSTASRNFSDSDFDRLLKEGISGAESLLVSLRLREDAETESTSTPASVLSLVLQNQRLRLELKEQQRQTEVFARGIFCLFKELLVQMLGELTLTVSNFFQEQLSEHNREAHRSGESVVYGHSAKAPKERSEQEASVGRPAREDSLSSLVSEKAIAVGKEASSSEQGPLHAEGSGEEVSRVYAQVVDDPSPEDVSSDRADVAPSL